MQFKSLLYQLKKKKKKPTTPPHNLNVESDVLFGGNFYNFKVGKQCLKSSWDNCSEEVRGRTRLYTNFATKGKVVWMSKNYCKLKKTRYPKLRNLAFFSCMGRCKSLGSLKSFFLICTPAIWGQYPCFHIMSFLRVHCREWLQTDGC